MEAVIQRHFRSTQHAGGRLIHLARLTPTMFVGAIVAARQDGSWTCYPAGIAGIAFGLSSDTRRHARILFQRDREMGAQGSAAPVVLFGADEHDLFEVASDDLIAWTLHLRGRRNSNESDVDFVRALFSVLKL